MGQQQQQQQQQRPQQHAAERLRLPAARLRRLGRPDQNEHLLLLWHPVAPLGRLGRRLHHHGRPPDRRRLSTVARRSVQRRRRAVQAPLVWQPRRRALVRIQAAVSGALAVGDGTGRDAGGAVRGVGRVLFRRCGRRDSVRDGEAQYGQHVDPVPGAVASSRQVLRWHVRDDGFSDEGGGVHGDASGWGSFVYVFAIQCKR